MKRLIIIFFVLVSCSGNSSGPNFAKDFSTIDSNKIHEVIFFSKGEYYEFGDVGLRTSDRVAIDSIVAAINNADEPQYYFGSVDSWDKMHLRTIDSNIILFTDGKVVSRNYDGNFYKLKTKNLFELFE